MELRHLRYFIAVAEAGSLTVAAQRMLHTSQPSLSRQIRGLEDEVGAQLLTRRARGIELTPAGRVFLYDIESILAAARQCPFEGNHRCSVSSKGTRGARLGVPSSRQGARGGGLA